MTDGTSRSISLLDDFWFKADLPLERHRETASGALSAYERAQSQLERQIGGDTPI
jgi:hypothetical protein